ncbi:MAG TPA: hypothetical protein DIV41_05235 [Ruminococcaceae bacterium]|nr:hypothetical protein [Oscillospiraceae bacterium]
MFTFIYIYAINKTVRRTKNINAAVNMPSAFSNGVTVCKHSFSLSYFYTYSIIKYKNEIYKA